MPPINASRTLHLAQRITHQRITHQRITHQRITHQRIKLQLRHRVAFFSEQVDHAVFPDEMPYANDD